MATRSSPAAATRDRARSASVVSEQRELVTQADALDLANEQTENVFLFVPNLIGYSRVILAALALHYMPYHPKACTVLYGLSSILDAVDGQAARALGQTSKFGAVLDMVTDRCATACLLCYLVSAYPRFAIAFQFLITLDFSSHYMHMYSSLITGATSHKLVKSDVSRILWLYYNNSLTLFAFCAGNEIFFVALYIIASSKLQPIGLWLTPLARIPEALAPFLPAEWATALQQVLVGLTWPQLVALLSFPVCFIKQVINVVQFWKASKILVGVDLAERQAARAAKKN